MSSISLSKTHLLNTKREQIYNKESKTPTKKIKEKKLALFTQFKQNLTQFNKVQTKLD